jgi:putative membrane protein
MNLVAALAALVAGLLHVLIFAMESLLFRRPQVYQRFATAASDVDAVRPWAFNQGFYNLFLGLGALTGVVWSGTVGRTLVAFACLCMLGAAIVLIGTDRRMARAALIQGLPPLVALVALAV